LNKEAILKTSVPSESRVCLLKQLRFFYANTKHMWTLCSGKTKNNRNLDRNTVIFQGRKRKWQYFVNSGVTAASI